MEGSKELPIEVMFFTDLPLYVMGSLLFLKFIHQHRHLVKILHH